MGPVALISIVALIIVVAVALSARVVKANERLVIFRMGLTRPSLERGPGLALLIPVIDRGVRVDLRTQSCDLVDIRMPTDDGKAVAVDATLRFRVVDAFKSVVNVAYLDGALSGVTEAALRSIAVQHARSDLVADLGNLQAGALAKATEAAQRWGTVIEGFEITDVRAVASS